MEKDVIENKMKRKKQKTEYKIAKNIFKVHQSIHKICIFEASQTI